MKSGRRDASASVPVSHSPWIAGLLLASLVLASVLAWQAQVSMRYHRAAAEKVLHDYAMLAADELGRRSVSELGFYGFYPLVTALRQASAKGRLLSPEELQASSDDPQRPSADLVLSTFRYDSETDALDALGPPLDPAVRAWMVDRLRTGAATTPRDGRYSTAHAVVAGELRSIVFGRASVGSAAPRPLLVGFESAPAAFAERFRRAVAAGPLFPPSLAHGKVPNDVLFLRILDPGGREVFRAGSPRQPDLGVERPFGSDYNGVLDGFVIRAAVDPGAARSLVIGGLPRSRLPFLTGLLALTAALILTAVLQLRRERALSDLRSQFVSRVSHELRTPLTQIRMFAETLLLNRVRSDEERRRSLEIIDRESRRLAHLVETILRFSRGERGEDRVDASARDLVPLVREILAEFAPIVRGPTRVASELPAEAVAVADEGALRQILLNLLDNAAKYGPPGQEIRVALSEEDGRVRLSVADEGPGIPASERDGVWRRFYRLPRDRESAVAGTGIGLAVVQDLVRLQGGRAWVEDAVGTGGRPSASAGARFVVELAGAPSDPSAREGAR